MGRSVRFSVFPGEGERKEGERGAPTRNGERRRHTGRIAFGPISIWGLVHLHFFPTGATRARAFEEPRAALSDGGRLYVIVVSIDNPCCVDGGALDGCEGFR